MCIAFSKKISQKHVICTTDGMDFASRKTQHLTLLSSQHLHLSNRAFASLLFHHWKRNHPAGLLFLIWTSRNGACSTLAILITFSRLPSIASCVVTAAGSDFITSLRLIFVDTAAGDTSPSPVSVFWCPLLAFLIHHLGLTSFALVLHCCWLSTVLTS